MSSNCPTVQRRIENHKRDLEDMAAEAAEEAAAAADSPDEMPVDTYTGVAASNIGEGAQTLSSMFRLSRINEASQDMESLKGTALTELVTEMKGVRLLIIDEISMVSRVVLAQVSRRLQEVRASEGDVDRMNLPFEIGRAHV